VLWEQEADVEKDRFDAHLHRRPFEVGRQKDSESEGGIKEKRGAAPTGFAADRLLRERKEMCDITIANPSKIVPSRMLTIDMYWNL
jgi:hypothetical protein